jgi:hypothetical protein
MTKDLRPFRTMPMTELLESSKPLNTVSGFTGFKYREAGISPLSDINKLGQTGMTTQALMGLGDRGIRRKYLLRKAVTSDRSSVLHPNAVPIPEELFSTMDSNVNPGAMDKVRFISVSLDIPDNLVLQEELRAANVLQPPSDTNRSLPDMVPVYFSANSRVSYPIGLKTTALIQHNDMLRDKPVVLPDDPDDELTDFIKRTSWGSTVSEVRDREALKGLDTNKRGRLFDSLVNKVKKKFKKK